MSKQTDSLAAWEPYRPPWYPEHDPNHNPWSTDPATYQQGHECFYTTWSKSLEPGELQRLIREHREAQRG